MAQEFGRELGFWDRTAPTLVGDRLNRPGAREMLGKVSGSRVLDVGCGTGYMSRTLATDGGIVCGIDNDVGTLARAIEHERAKALGIEYREGSIASIPYPGESFHAALCVSVLMYCPPEDARRFFAEAARVLVTGGKLVVAVTHPDCYHHPELTRSWLDLEPIEESPAGYAGPAGPYRQRYKNASGEWSTLTVWNHSCVSYFDWAAQAGFVLEEAEDIPFPRDLVGYRGSGVWGNNLYLHARFSKS